MERFEGFLGVNGRRKSYVDIESQVRNEIAVLKKVSMGHQNILTLVDYFETMNNRTLPRNLPIL